MVEATKPPAEPPWSRPVTPSAQGRLLAILTTVAVLAALHAARSVALPLAFALFLIAILWPVQLRLQRWLRPGLAFAATLLGFSVVLWLFGWTLAECVDEAAERWPRYEPRFQELVEGLRARAAGWGLQLDEGGRGGGVGSWLRSSLRTTFEVSGGLLLTLALVVLGLLEVQQFRDKLRQAVSGTVSAQVVQAAHESTARFGQYFWARTVMSVLQGVVTGLFAWAVGLDLALVWGVLSALLNYVPTIGSVVAVIPPALFALVQFPGAGKALVVIGGLAAIQVVLGNYLDPRIQGRWLSLSPFVVLLSITFWGFLWGPAGALIGVPLTIAIVIVCQRSRSLRWIAVLLSTPAPEGVKAPPGPADPPEARLEELRAETPRSQRAR